MNKLKTARLVAILLMFLTGINALVAGLLFITDPSGAKMGMTTGYLKHAPFQNFLIPGIVLFTANGLLNIGGAVMVIRKSPWQQIAVFLQGVLLCGWIVIQVIMVRDINPLHIIMLSIGFTLIACSRFIQSGPANDTA